LLNAAINARDAMPDGGTITITTRNVAADDGDMVCIAMIDDGPGMTNEVIARAFEPFFTTKPVGKGTGLGLSQIHGFAAQSGGRAEIESTVGQGTTVRMLLPRAAGAIPAAAEQAKSLPRGGNLLVLLVEDNERVRAFAEELLAALDYRVLVASSAEGALQMLADEPIDIVFSDVVMPGTSGLQLARTIAADYPHLPILLTSGYSKDVTEGTAHGFELLPKPYSADSLAAALARVRARADASGA
jgi:CheY-like chemotaxis protein